MRSCDDVKILNPFGTSGVYLIVNNHQKVQVYCDFTTDEGAWTVSIHLFVGSLVKGYTTKKQKLRKYQLLKVGLNNFCNFL